MSSITTPGDWVDSSSTLNVYYYYPLPSGFGIAGRSDEERNFIG
jgi:hypothetical protein